MSVQKSNGPIIDPALCRCCRAIKKCRVLTAEYNWQGKKEVYADMVMDCYGILLSHVDDNEKDSGVCATCVVRLREATAFRHQVLQCEELFLQAKLAPPEEEPNIINYENKLKKLELETIELKTEPKDYSDHHSDMDDRDDGVPAFNSDEEDNKPLKPETKPVEPPPLKDEEVKSEDSEDYNGSSSDSDEPIKKKAKRKSKKANGKEGKKKVAKASKKQKADMDETTDVPLLTEEIHIKMESDSDTFEENLYEVPVELDLSLPEGSKKKRQWVRDKADGISEYDLLTADADDDIYFEHMNMSKSAFEELHKMVEDQIEKIDTNYRKSISTRERLAIGLRFLRTGLSYMDISTKYRVGRSTVSNIVKDVTRALWGTLQPVYMPAPKEHIWRQAEAGFKALEFPNCVGSIGGRHIVVKQLKGQTEYPQFSDKNCHKRLITVTLLVVTDANNKILALDIGNYSKDGHISILEKSKFFGRYMENKDFLPWKPLPGDSELSPHVLVNDGTFTIRHNLLRRFPETQNYTPQKRNFNKYLSNACTAEDTFEMLLKSWTILHRPLESQVDTSVAILKAICCLHNYILAKHGETLPSRYKASKKIGKRSSKTLSALEMIKPTNHRASNVATAVRDRFVEYFARLNPECMDPKESESTGKSMEVGSSKSDESIMMGHFMSLLSGKSESAQIKIELECEADSVNDDMELCEPAVDKTIQFETVNVPNEKEEFDAKTEEVNVAKDEEFNSMTQTVNVTNDMQEFDSKAQTVNVTKDKEEFNSMIQTVNVTNDMKEFESKTQTFNVTKDKEEFNSMIQTVNVTNDMEEFESKTQTVNVTKDKEEFNSMTQTVNVTNDKEEFDATLEKHSADSNKSFDEHL